MTERSSTFKSEWIYLCRSEREFSILKAEADDQCAASRHPHVYGRLRHCAEGLGRAESVCAERWSREWVEGVGWPVKRSAIALGPAQ